MKKKRNILAEMDERLLFVIGLILCICIFFAFYRPYVSNDTSFMILQAKNMLKNGIVHTDSYTMHKNLVYYPQKWLMNFIVLFFYTMDHTNGLIIGTYIICILKTISIYLIIHCLNKGKTIMNIIISAFTIYAHIGFNDLRPYVLSLCFMLLLIYGLEKYIEKRNIRYLLVVPISSFFIMSLHSTMWLLFIICMMPYIFELQFVEKILHAIGFKSIVITKKYDKKPILIAFVMGILVAFFNPNGADQFVYIYKMMTGLYHSSFISELSPVYVTAHGCKIVFCMLLLFLFAKIYEKVDLRFVYFFIGGCIMILQASRNMNYFIIFSALFAANVAKNSSKKLEFKNNIFLIIFLIVAVVITTLCSGTIILMDNAEYKQHQQDMMSISMAKYMDQHVDKNAKIFNAYGCGATLELYGFKPYIDERSEVFDIAINEKVDVLGEYYDYANNPIKTFDYLQKKYDFDYAVVYADNKYDDYFSLYDNMMELYRDDNYVIYKID